MSRRVVLAVALVVWALASPARADHSTAIGINCSNFQFQEDAQAYFNAHPGDPEGLDGPPGAQFSGVQNMACENLPRRAATTTTLGTTTTSAVPTTTTVAIPAEPNAILSGSSGQVVGDLDSYCWPAADLGGMVVCSHIDYVEPGPDPATSLTVTQGEVVTLRYQPAFAVATLQVGLWPRGSSNAALPAPATNPSSFGVNLAPGRYLLSVLTTFHGVPQGRLGHIFEIVVKAKVAKPAQPQPRRIALTG